MEMNEELRKDAELGRKAKIAEEFFREYLDTRREEIVREIEAGEMDDHDLRISAIELQVIKRFHYECEHLIQRGEIAEEELRNGE